MIKNYKYFYSLKKIASIWDDIRRLSDPGSKIITRSLEMIREAENFPPENILFELKQRLQEIDRVLRKALSVRSNPALVERYRDIIDLERQLYASISAPFGTFQNQRVAFSSIAKLAMVDPALYNEVRQRISSVMPVAAQLDSALSLFASEIQQLRAGQPAQLPEAEFFQAELPSLEKREEEAAPEGPTFPPAFSDFINRISSYDEGTYEQYKAGLKAKMLESTQQKISDPSVTEEQRVLLTSKYDIGANLDHLRNLARRGYVREREPAAVRGRETVGFLNRYKYMLNTILPYADEMKDQPFESILINHPYLLNQLAAQQWQIEDPRWMQKKIPEIGEPSRPEEERGRYLEEMGREHFVMPPDLKSFFESHDIYDDQSIYAMREDLKDEVFDQHIVPEIIDNPELYQSRFDKAFLDKIEPQQRDAAVRNNAAINYSMYQLHSHHAQITAILQSLAMKMRELVRSKQTVGPEESIFVQERQEDVRQILRVCFPEKLVETTRRAILPDDKKLLTSGRIEKVPVIDSQGNIKEDKATPYLFDSVPSGENWHERMIDMMAEKVIQRFNTPQKVTRKVKPSYFSFGGRVSIGYLLSYAYGGAYRARSWEVPSYQNVVEIDPEYYKKPITFASLTDYSQPFWGKDQKFVAAMEGITDHIKDIVQTSEEIDDRALFYLGYMNASTKSTLEQRIGIDRPLTDIMYGWRDEYYKNVTQASSTRTVKKGYTYQYPLRYLFV